MLRALACCLALLALGACAPGAVDPAPQQLAAAPPKLDQETARTTINAYRAHHGLRPLVIEARLTRAAELHAHDLAAHDRISHSGTDGSDPWQRLRRTGYNPRVVAENVGAGQTSLAEVIKGWQESPGHDANLLLADATEMGIALVYDPNTRYRTFWTLELGAPRWPR